MRRTYRLRYDVQKTLIRIQQINREGLDSTVALTALPSLDLSEEISGRRGFSFTSEHNRLLRHAVRRFRHHLEPKELVNDLMDVSQKLTDADRTAIYLRQPGEDIFRETGFSRLGLAPDLDSKLIRASCLLEKAVAEKHYFYIRNIITDSRFLESGIGRYIGERSILVTPMRAAREVIGVIYLDSRIGSSEMLERNAPVVQELADEAALSLEISSLYRDLDDTFMSMVRALGSAVDAKDSYTHGHAARVAEYALLIGRELRLRQEDLRDLEIGAYLHDIGKIGIANVILKSQDTLTDQEMAEIRQHPVIGTRILSPVRKLSKVALAIRQHHERYDGKGYPDQVKGNKILMIARIIAVADALDAMTTIRPYHKPMTLSASIEVIVNNAGTQFDPLVAAATKKLFHKGQFKKL
ncbi:HD domain-containing protein [bacterium]|nr:HD domain-containing protein [bacterium]